MRISWKQKSMALFVAVTVASQLLSGSVVTSVKANATNQGQQTVDSFETDAVLDFTRTASVSIGTANEDGGVAEIVAYNKDNQKTYVVNGQEGVLNVIPLQEEGNFGEPETIEVKNLIEEFEYGDMTSVAVDTVHDRIVIALQAADYAANGQVAVLDYEGKLMEHYETGVQPDMVTFTKDGNKVLTANEGEPREGYGDGTTDPAGSITVVNLTEKTAKTVGFEDFDAEELASQGILFNKVNDEIVPAETDLEPEYIAVTDDGGKAYISLQEANAIAVMDLEAEEITDIKSVGFVDYSEEKNAVDLLSDENYGAKQYENALGVRMPDGISLFEKEGKTYLLTANEGDAREWGVADTPQYFCNETKKTLTASDGTTAKKVRSLDESCTAGLEADKNYLFGSRSFSIFDAETMELVYDSGNQFEKKTAQWLPDYFNCSNNDTEQDSRSQKKGPEPESITVGAMDGRIYAFVAIERIGGIMIYDVTDPAEASYMNYVNTRDFSQIIAGDVAPEGLAFVPANQTASGLPMLIAACEVSGTVAGYSITGTGAQDAVILYTNDIHCAIDGYSGLAAYSERMTEQGYRNILVDAGDAIQGEVIGALTKGEAIADLMNQTGYELAVPGNHEFDYKMDAFLKLAKNAKFKYLSANLLDLQTEQTVFDGFAIKNVGGKKIAFVGISTPESYTKSSPAYFQNEKGEYIYSFSEDNFYEVIQNTIDDAKTAGADYVIAVGHTGIEGTTEEWKSTSIIANTTGIDVYLDAHSHEVIEGQQFENKDGDKVLLSSTGTKFENFGKLIIGADGSISTELISPDTVDREASQGVKNVSGSVQKTIDQYNEWIDSELKKAIGTSETALTINNPDSGERWIRKQETNMGDFVADAYRAVTGADLALANGGGIRAPIAAGDVSKKNLMDVNPWSNSMCVIEATGQQILDALEHGVKKYPEESGGFLQVSGLTYEINKTVTESPVVTDEKGVFQSVAEGKKRRVQNVKVNGVAIDPDKTYKVAGSQYTLLEGGDGFSMFQADSVVTKDNLPTDAEMLIQYFTENLNGTIPASRYGKAAGEGRILIVDKDVEPEPTPTPTPTATPTATPTVTPTAVPSTPAPTVKPAAAATTKVGKVKITSVKKKTGRKLQIKLQKVSKADGYEVKISTSKKFTKKKTSAKNIKTTKVVLKKMKKGKTYYIKARAYRKTTKGKVYGKYSKVKKISY